MRVQIQYAPALDLPEHVLITSTRVSDQKGLDQILLDDPQQLAQLRGHTLLIDLGYYSHRHFRRLLAAGVHFISRLHPQAKVQIRTEDPVQQSLPTLPAGRIAVLSDQHINLGPDNNRVRGLRLVTARVEALPKAAHRGAKPIVYKLLTDRFDLSAAEVVQLYLWRWQIELFLRWLKSHVHMPRLLGYSRNALELTVYLAIVVHLLTVLAARSLGLARRSPALLAQMIWALVTVDLAGPPGAENQLVQLQLPLWHPIDPEPI